MALDAAGQLAAAQLAIYLILVIPSIYALWKHSWHGLLGWGYLFAFCSLRIIGSALQVSNEKHGTTNSTAQIISGVGLSPLVLAFIGILHESNHYNRVTKSFLLTITPSIILHLIVGAALALVVLGYQPHQKNGKALQEVGYIIFVIIWLCIVALTALSWRQQVSQFSFNSKRLLNAVTLTLPLLGIRVLYGCVASFDPKVNAFTGPIAYRVCLAVLPEFVIVSILSIFGVWTRHIRSEDAEKEVKPGKV